jgi:hypothetical protein
VTALEAYELTTRGGATDFARLIRACERSALIASSAAWPSTVTSSRSIPWMAYADPRRRLSKRKKDELDLIRLAEAYPELKRLYPSEVRQQLDCG